MHVTALICPETVRVTALICPETVRVIRYMDGSDFHVDYRLHGKPMSLIQSLTQLDVIYKE